MVTAIVLLNVARTQVNAVAETLAEMAGISEVYSVTGELDLAAIVSVATNEDLARALGQASHTAHVVIETAQFLVDRPGLGRWLGNDALLAQNAKQQSAACAELATVTADRLRAVATGQVFVEEAADNALVQLRNRAPTLAHPLRKVCEARQMSATGCCRVIAALRTVDVRIDQHWVVSDRRADSQQASVKRVDLPPSRATLAAGSR